MASGHLKLLSVLIMVLTVLGGAGFYFSSRTGTESHTVTITPYATTASSTETIMRPTYSTEWITVSQVKSVDYYLSLLYSNGTSPYGHLYWELRKLPDITNATAVAKITYLALNATNLEVREAFELMIKGGTPDQRDFTYLAPSWNTELQVLYWLACQNEFKKDDTLALAMAMVNGLWVTMGDDKVREAVRKDASDLLSFFRETDVLQQQKGFWRLEGYPLEAKVCLAWTGSITPNFSNLPLIWGIGRNYQTRSLGYLANGIRVNIEGYSWNTVDVATLKLMQEMMTREGWISSDIYKTIAFLEEYFYFSRRHLIGHWDKEPVFIMVDGRQSYDYTIGNVDWQYDFFVRTGNFQGQCTDESQWIDAWAKSWGIATNTVWRGAIDSSGQTFPQDPQHFHPVFFDPASRSWKASAVQLGVEEKEAGTRPLVFAMFRPPVNQQRYFKNIGRTPFHPNLNWLYGLNSNMFYWYPQMTTLKEISAVLTAGLSTSEMKQWLLYS
ncbi:hypothetical protein MUP05_03310 [Candidatus Bathyarchaeota archaeon]|nr:hypothetical protein [Candidatus Bathyarchaeota archaeon]